MPSDLPGALRASIEAGLSEVGTGRIVIRGAVAVSGGDIHRAARLETEDESLFLKWNPTAPVELFEAEAEGLDALRGAAGADLRVPRPIAVGECEVGAWLVMTHLRTGRPDPGHGERLGRGLAALHRRTTEAEGRVGWDRDNWIGSLPQRNAPAADWPTFWRDRRLGPQLRRARESGVLRGGDADALERLLDRTPELLAEVEEPPVLLHGDLWGGNQLATLDGVPALFDPAVYRGHREVDLAMSELFGFPSGFLEAYREAWSVPPLYDERRRDLYQLYYLLVHLNLFGASYLPGCLRAAERALSTL